MFNVQNYDIDIPDRSQTVKDVWPRGLNVMTV